MSSNPPSPQQGTTIDEYHRLEINEILQRTRLMIEMRMQAAAFLGTANFTVVGLAFALKVVGLFFVAAGIGVLFLALDGIAGQYSKPLYERGVELEKLYAPDAKDAILNRRQESFDAHKGQSYLASEVRFWLPFAMIALEVLVGIVLWQSGWAILS